MLNQIARGEMRLRKSSDFSTLICYCNSVLKYTLRMFIAIIFCLSFISLEVFSSFKEYLGLGELVLQCCFPQVTGREQKLSGYILTEHSFHHSIVRYTPKKIVKLSAENIWFWVHLS